MNRVPGRLGRPARVAAGGMGAVMLITGAFAFVPVALAVWEGRGDDARWNAAGASGLLLGLFMVQSARTGRDELRAWLNRMIPNPRADRPVKVEGS